MGSCAPQGGGEHASIIISRHNVGIGAEAEKEEGGVGGVEPASEIQWRHLGRREREGGLLTSLINTSEHFATMIFLLSSLERLSSWWSSSPLVRYSVPPHDALTSKRSGSLSPRGRSPPPAILSPLHSASIMFSQQ